VKGTEVRQLERDLQSDLIDNDAAVRSRLRESIKLFLFDEATRIAGVRSIKEEKEILNLIGIYARVETLKTLIEDPKRINPKDLKDMLKVQSMEAEAPKNMGELIAGLDIEGVDKARLVAGAMDLVKRQLEQRGS
jgi:hypothetical protein